MSILSMTDLDLAGKRVLIREDLNVPLEGTIITDDSRICRALPTIQAAIDSNAKVMLISHLGRPTAGTFDPKFSLAPVAQRLSQLLGQPVPIVRDWPDNNIKVTNGQVILFENVRFLRGEKANDPALAKKMAALCDIFVMDAFATAHRAHASTTGVSEYAPIACAGPLLLEELQNIHKVLHSPKPPVAAIVGGSKVSTKIQLLEHLLPKIDCLITGGGIANTLLKAEGVNIGTSLFEPNWVEASKDLLHKAKQNNVNIPLPIDVVVAHGMNEGIPQIKNINHITNDDMILDIGPATIKKYNEQLKRANTIIWNGPVGVFENEAFANGTRELALTIGSSKAYSIAGGGDTVAALNRFGIQGISYISTGGGAFLTMMQGEQLPAIAALEQRARQHV
ncbi:MAG: phosphoglycerate kinase [Gammaproteobacteria bacterium RIFCSPHIGHO2_12_FULL_41_15]|nr:MAG: phosphoglycerate kinase [Gammaproteobacteria bacterium RIFCSPHIGHO2_12_FULL_41_15]